MSYDDKPLLTIRLDRDVSSDFLDLFALLATGFTFSTSYGQGSRDRKHCEKGQKKGQPLIIGFSYSVDGAHRVSKDLYISNFIGVRIFADLVSRLSLHSASKIQARIWVVERGISGSPEVERESLLSMAHYAARGLGRFIHEDYIRGTIKYEISSSYSSDQCYNDSWLPVLALSLVSLLSPASRQSLGIRQLAAQEILRIVEESISKPSCDLEKSQGIDLLLRILSLLVVDTYIWLPYHLAKIASIYGGELTFSVAARTLLDAVKHIVERNYSSRDLACILRDSSWIYKEAISRTVIDFGKRVRRIGSRGDISKITCDLSREIEETISEILRRTMNIKDRSETLVGRLSRICKGFGITGDKSDCTQRSTQDQGKKVTVSLISITEQTGPAIIRLLGRDRWPERLVLIYTPQTYYNYLYTLLALRSIARSECGNQDGQKCGVAVVRSFDELVADGGDHAIKIYPVLIPAIDGYIAGRIAEGLGKALETLKNNLEGNKNKIDQIDLEVSGLLQGVATVSLPLYIELEKLFPGSVKIL